MTSEAATFQEYSYSLFKGQERNNVESILIEHIGKRINKKRFRPGQDWRLSGQLSTGKRQLWQFGLAGSGLNCFILSWPSQAQDNHLFYFPSPAQDQEFNNFGSPAQPEPRNLCT